MFIENTIYHIKNIPVKVITTIQFVVSRKAFFFQRLLARVTSNAIVMPNFIQHLGQELISNDLLTTETRVFANSVDLSAYVLVVTNNRCLHGVSVLCSLWSKIGCFIMIMEDDNHQFQNIGSKFSQRNATFRVNFRSIQRLQNSFITVMTCGIYTF